MPVYMYRCPLCHDVFSTAQSIADYSTSRSRVCPECDIPLNRVYTPPAITPMMDAHFNPSVGRYVRNKADLTSALSQLSDETSARTGVPSRYEAIDPRDTSALGVTEAGLESTLRRQYDQASRVGRSPSQEANPTRWL
jgi:putative FmdB family regulatory protein